MALTKEEQQFILYGGIGAAVLILGKVAYSAFKNNQSSEYLSKSKGHTNAATEHLLSARSHIGEARDNMSSLAMGRKKKKSRTKKRR